MWCRQVARFVQTAGSSDTASPATGDGRITPVSDNDLETRVTNLEHDMVKLREDGASARVLTALADRDVTEFRTQLRGHHRVLSALRETQLEQGTEIPGLRREMREGFATLATGMAQITALLTTLAAELSRVRG